MARKTKPRIIGTLGAALSGVWGAYSHLSTAASLGEDVTALEAFMADPPAYLPWVLFAGFFIIAAWAFWPSDDADADDDEPPANNFTSAHNSQIVQRVEGDMHVTYGEQMSDSKEQPVCKRTAIDIADSSRLSLSNVFIGGFENAIKGGKNSDIEGKGVTIIRGGGKDDDDKD